MTLGFPESPGVAPEALCRVDGQARFTDVNAECAALLGRPPAELHVAWPLSFMPGEALSEVERGFIETRAWSGRSKSAPPA